MKSILQEDPRLRWLLLAALAVQLITCITAIGVYHPDQHFQIIEFSSFQLRTPSAARQLWELPACIRPTLQVYLFSGYYLLCQALGIADPYTQLSLLRLLMGVGLWCVFNAICIYYFKDASRKILYTVLLVLNFSWLLPYTRTLYSSEMLSSVLFFGALFLYDVKRKTVRSLALPLLTGFLFSLSFYARFQLGLAIAGVVVWMGWQERWHILPLVGGLLIGVLLNAWLDYGFYQAWVLTPYNYYFENIARGRAAAFGTSSFLVYIAVLVALVATPPLSLSLLFAGMKASFQRLRVPFVLPILFFIVGHCFVGHKEERFLFPVLNMLPLFAGWGLPGMVRFYRGSPRWLRGLMNAGIGFSVCLDVFLLVALIFTPYSQAIHFTWLLKRQLNDRPTTVYCIRQSPFETASGLSLVFYRRAADNIELRTLPSVDSLRGVTGHAIYVSATYNETSDEEKSRLAQLGYRPVTYASRFLWDINRWLHARHINTINDIWVLYKKE